MAQKYSDLRLFPIPRLPLAMKEDKGPHPEQVRILRVHTVVPRTDRILYPRQGKRSLKVQGIIAPRTVGRIR